MGDEHNENIVWTDLETTGLVADRGFILEVAIVITDKDYRETARFHSVLNYHPQFLQSCMTREVAVMHKESGLLREVIQVGPGREPATHHSVDLSLVKFLKKNGGIGAPLAGSSAHFDKDWVRRHLPLTFSKLHYRIIDVSSVKEMAQRRGWKLETGAKSAHRAMLDVLYSIELAKFYDEHVFQAPPSEELKIPQPEDIEGYKKGSAPVPVEAPKAPEKLETETKVVTLKAPGETRVEVLHADHKEAPKPRGGTKVVTHDPVSTEAPTEPPPTEEAPIDSQ